MIAISAVLEERGIKPSLHRIKIFEFLDKNRIHPTVDEIYNLLLPVMPTLSRTTIYNTVKLFAEKGLLDTLTIEDNEIRYDIDTSSHSHFKCISCRQVYDLPSEKGSQGGNTLPGFVIQKAHTYYHGLCPNCSGVTR